MSATLTEVAQPATANRAYTNGGKQPYDFSQLEPYVHPPESKEDLPWAELVTLDLGEISQPGGKERLAKQLEHAVHRVGFFYVKNFGLSKKEVDRQFTLAKNFFELPLEQKLKYEVDYKNADYNGYRRAGLRTIGKVPDNVEMFNIPKFIPEFEGKYTYPDLLEAHMEEIERFSKILHHNIVLPLLRLFAIILQLPDEEYLVRQHTYDERSEDHFRYMIYNKRTPEEHEASGFGQSSGHTDLGSLTLLFRQPVAGLQILGEDASGNESWSYVSAQPGTVTVNLADTLSHLTGGYLKSSIHRVVAPPQDQWDYNRTGLLYFARPHSDTVLYPITNSPVLQQEGVKPRFDKPVTMAEWVKAKQLTQLNPKEYDQRRKEDGSLEIIGGFKDRYYK